MRRFLFIGHADAKVTGGPRTLGFASADGSSLTIAPNDQLAGMFGASAKSKGGQLELVFLNGCCSQPLGELIRQQGVEYVVCWRTKALEQPRPRLGRSVACPPLP